jgi:hypothetical protein
VVWRPKPLGTSSLIWPAHGGNQSARNTTYGILDSYERNSQSEDTSGVLVSSVVVL